MVSRWVRNAGIALAGLFVAGCGPVTLVAKPDTFNVPAEAGAKLRSGQSVSLNNAYKAKTDATVYSVRDQPGWIGDLQQYTDTAIVMLGKEMAKRAVTVGPQAAKSVTLRVYDVKGTPGWTIQVTLALEAQYGDGTKSVILTENSSPSDAWRALDGAIMFAVSRLLRDDDFLAYVNK
jgi:hypothetical protein